MDHAIHTRLGSSEILGGATICVVGDEKVGSVSHLHGSQIVIDIGHFLGIGAKPVATSASPLDFMRDEDADVHAITTWTKELLEDTPTHQD